jgi:hypothetical protein
MPRFAQRDRAYACAANTTVTDAAIARAQLWAKIDDLQRRIAGLEGDAQNQDDLANQLEHTGKGKNDAITKLFNAAGSVPAVKYHAEAAKYRAEEARLCEELAQLENQPHRLPTVLLPNVFHTRVPEGGFVLSLYCGSNDLRHPSGMTLVLNRTRVEHHASVRDLGSLSASVTRFTNSPRYILPE